MTRTPWFFCRGVLIHFLFSLMQQLDSLYIKHFKLQVTLMLLNVISPLGEKQYHFYYFSPKTTKRL